MASTINAQTSPLTAIIMEADATGNLAIQTANVTALTIDSSQNVSLVHPLPIGSGGTGATSLSGITVGTANTANSTVAALTAGSYLTSGGTFNGSTARTFAVDADSANTASKVVVRDAGGNFSAGTITANLTGTASTATTATSATSATTATSASNLTGGNITGNMIVANATSPNSYYLQFGDNTGWVYRFMTNVSGTPTVRFSFQDNGAFTAVNNVTAYSDERLKKNWRPVQEDFVENLAKVKSGIYDRTDIEATQAGVSAQDMQKLLAETVQTGEDGTLSLAYGNAALVAAIELAKQVVELKKEIELLKAR